MSRLILNAKTLGIDQKFLVSSAIESSFGMIGGIGNGRWMLGRMLERRMCVVVVEQADAYDASLRETCGLSALNRRGRVVVWSCIL